MGISSHSGPDDEADEQVERTMVQSIREGQPDAFRALMELYFPQAIRLANTFVYDQDQAEDIAQTVFTHIWENRKDWNPRVSVRSYIMGAIRHRALNVLKHRAVRAKYAVLEVAEESLHNGVAVHERLDMIAKLTALQTAVMDLPERRRVALILRFEMELSYPEVGATLGISANAAKELVVRTIETLRLKLHDLS